MASQSEKMGGKMEMFYIILLAIAIVLAIGLVINRNKPTVFEQELSGGYIKFYGGGKMDLVWTIVIVLIVLWVLGQIGSIGGGLINILLAIALIIIVYRLAQGKDMLTGK